MKLSQNQEAIMRRCLYYVLAALLFSAALLLWGPRAQQVKRMALARTHIDCLMVDLREDERFANVRLQVGTGDRAPLIVIGTVATKDACDKLGSIVEGSDPPIGVLLIVYVAELNQELSFVKRVGSGAFVELD